MNIQTKALKLNNLIIYQTRQLRTDWFEGIFIMEDFLLTEGIYKNGPILFSVEPEYNEEKFGNFTYYLPINEAVKLKETIEFSFIDELYVEEALLLRQAEEEVDFQSAFQKMKDYAVEYEIPIDDTFYCVLLEVYGEYMIDLYVPLVKGEEVS